MMFKKKAMYVLALLFLLIISISSASAMGINSTDEIVGEDLVINDEYTIINEDSNEINEINDQNSDGENINAIEENTLLNANSDNSNPDPVLNDPQNITVTTKTFSAIQSAIDGANDGDTIILSGTYSNDLSKYIEINKTINVIGMNDAVLNANNLSGIFKVNVTEDISISNITFMNGRANDGGAIYGFENFTSCINCTFLNNYAGRFYGAIRANAIDCTFRNNTAGYQCGAMYGYAFNCTFINNSASGYGALGGYAIYCTFINNSAGSGGAMDDGTAINCTFINNTATSSGGAMSMAYTPYQTGSATAINCTFINNSAASSGAVSGNAINCTFINNSASDYGGAVSGSATNCTFINNSAGSSSGALRGSATNCTFINNSAGDFGGAIGLYKGEPISNCTFYNNSAGIEGSVIYFNGDYTNGYQHYYYDLNILGCNFLNSSDCNPIFVCNASSFNLINSTFSGCDFENESARLLVFDNVSSANIVNDSFVNCSFNASGSFLHLDYILSKDINVSSCTFENSSFSDKGLLYSDRRSIYFDNCSFINDDFDSGGIALVDGASSCNLVDCYFKNNSISEGTIIDLNKYKFPSGNCYFINNTINNGSLVFTGNDLSEIRDLYFENNSILGGNLIELKAENSSIINCSFIQNNAINGGALSLENISLCNLVDCSFESNTASIFGGAIYSTNSSINIENCSFNGNNAKYGGVISAEIGSEIYINGSHFNDNEASDNGGVIYSGNSIFIIDNSTFLSNSASTCAAISLDYDSILNITDSNFTNNSARHEGAIGCTDYGNNIFICNTSFYRNYANTGNAGAISANCNNLTAVNCSFIKNSAITCGAATGGTYINSTFEGNSASIFAGAIANGTAINCTFSNNYGSMGGAIYQGNATNCTFIGNNGTNGGAIGFSGYFPPEQSYEISNCTFIDNFAYDSGGAFSLFYGNNVSISNCSFINNSAINNGAVASYENASLNISGSSFINNSANGSGGVIYYSNASLDISNCSFVNNSANGSGGAIFSLDGHLVISHDTSFENNTCNGSGAALYIENATDVSISSCEFANCVSGDGGGSIITDDYDSLNISDCIFDVVPEGISCHYSSIILADDLYFALGSDGILVVSLSNVCGPLAGKVITLAVGDESCTNITDSDGLARFNVKDYFNAVGNYSVTVSFAGDDLTDSNSTTVNVNVYNYKGVLSVNSSGKYYNEVNVSFRLVDSNTLIPIIGANILVAFSNGENVTLVTDSDGSASYILPFAPGTYSLTATVTDDNVEVNETTLENIEISRIVGKIDISQDGNVLIIRLYNQTTGEVYGNVLVSIKFNGTNDLNLTTNDEGIISFDMTVLGFGTYFVTVEVKGDFKDFDLGIATVQVKNDTEEKISSQVSFSKAVVFDYGKTGSTTVAVIGGIIELANISVDGHPEAVVSIVNNVIKVSGLKVGSYTLHVKTTPDETHYSVTSTIGITVRKVSAAIKASNHAAYSKENKKWSIKLIDKRTNKTLSKMQITLKIYTGSKYKTVKLTTNSKGIVTYKASTLSVGKHKVVISFSKYGHSCSNLVRYVTVKKRIKLTYTTKSDSLVDGSNLFVWVKKSNKPINKVKIRMRVYTGKKYKDYILTTGNYKSDGNVKRGFIGYGTNMLSAGKHKIVLKPYAYKYTGSKTVYMVIKSSAKKYKQSQVFVSNGKRSMNY